MTVPASPSRIVITGASGAIGRAIALALARPGNTLGLTQRVGGGSVKGVLGDIVRLGAAAAAIEIPGSTQQLASRFTDFGPFDALVLVGAPPPVMGSVFQQPEAEYAAQFAGTVTGNLQLVQAAVASSFRKIGAGHVVAVGSAAVGPPPAPNMAAYATAKLAMVGLLRSVCAEGKGFGMRASVVHPSYVETPMLSAFNPRFVELARNQVGRFLSPEEVAQAIAAALDEPPAAGECRELTLRGSRT